MMKSKLAARPLRHAARLALTLSLLLPATVAGAASAAELEQVRALAQKQVEARSLKSLLLQIRLDGQEVLTLAHGEALAGVPATAEGHFRNGAVALAYVSTIMLRLAEEGVVKLDEPIGRWMPDLPEGDTVTLRMLANMTAGYPDYVADAGFLAALDDNPFRAWTAEELIGISLAAPRRFAPGSNWDYSHSSYVILGRALERASGWTMRELMEHYVLAPLELTGTRSEQSALMPQPAIHGFTGERGIYEDATFWNPSWTLADGAVQTTTISDMARSFDIITGTDDLLNAASRQAMIAPVLVGTGAPLDGCPTCHELTADFSYGLGVFLVDDWVMQTPLFGGYAAAVATLPAERAATGRRLTIAAAATFNEASQADWNEALPNWADDLVRQVATLLAPGNAPPRLRLAGQP